MSLSVTAGTYSKSYLKTGQIQHKEHFEIISSLAMHYLVLF